MNIFWRPIIKKSCVKNFHARLFDGEPLENVHFWYYKGFYKQFYWLQPLRQETWSNCAEEVCPSFFMQLLDFPQETREDSIHLHESLEENLEVVWKMKGILLPRNYFKFPFVKIVVSKIVCKSLMNIFWRLTIKKSCVNFFSGASGIYYWSKTCSN